MKDLKLNNNAKTFIDESALSLILMKKQKLCVKTLVVKQTCILFKVVNKKLLNKSLSL